MHRTAMIARATIPAIRSLSCRCCGTAFDFEPGPFAALFPAPELCDACDATESAARAREDAARAATASRSWQITRWRQAVPERYQRTDTAHPRFDPVLWERVSAWHPTVEKPWLGIVGPPGLCKTRVITLRLRDWLISAGEAAGHRVPQDRESRRPQPKDPLFITASEFGEAVAARHAAASPEDAARARDLLSRCRTAGWLLFDDVGKAKHTPAVVAALFALMDHRHTRDLTTLWTANSKPETFCRDMGPDIAAPLARRFNELSTLLAVS